MVCGTRLTRLALPAVLACLCLSVLSPARSDETGAAIRNVILTQIEAFANDDELGAWVHASKAIQKRLRSPEMLLLVVQRAYPPVHRPGLIQFGDRYPHDRFEIQVVRLEGPQGRLWDAYYRMVQKGSEWKVGGVTLHEADMGI